jgi:hypothetical protein
MERAGLRERKGSLPAIEASGHAAQLLREGFRVWRRRLPLSGGHAGQQARHMHAEAARKMSAEPAGRHTSELLPERDALQGRRLPLPRG